MYQWKRASAPPLWDRSLFFLLLALSEHNKTKKPHFFFLTKASTLPSPLWAVWKPDSTCASAASATSPKSHSAPGPGGSEDWRSLILVKSFPAGSGRLERIQPHLNASSGEVQRGECSDAGRDAGDCSAKTGCQRRHRLVCKWRKRNGSCYQNKLNPQPLLVTVKETEVFHSHKCPWIQSYIFLKHQCSCERSV